MNTAPPSEPRLVLLLREAGASDLQNRQGFVLAVARELAELRGEKDTAGTLARHERALDASRLQREDAFRESMTDAERRWLRQHRPARAAHWNMLSTMTASELASGKAAVDVPTAR